MKARAPELRPHHGHHLMRLPIQVNAAADDGGIATEQPAPRSVFERDDLRSVRHVVVGTEGPPEQGSCSEDVEPLPRDPLGSKLFRKPAPHVAHTSFGGHRRGGEDLGGVAHVREIRRRHGDVLQSWPLVADAQGDEPTGILRAHRMQQHGVDRAEHRGIGGNAYSQREDGDGGEAAMPDQRADRIPAVLPRIGREPPDDRVPVVVGAVCRSRNRRSPVKTAVRVVNGPTFGRTRACFCSRSTSR